MMPFRFAVLSIALAMTAPALALPAVASGPFAAEVAAFGAASDVAPAPGGTLFIGSSSMRLWDVKSDFAEFHPVNHGFGGAHVTDVLDNYPLVIAGLHPASIIVYVGENDIVAGRDADAVARDVTTLLAQLRRDFPAARIAYLSMKASPARWALRAAMDQANVRVHAAAGAGRFDYIDVASSLVARDAADPDCFRADGIHLNAEGYGRWRAIVTRYLANGGTPATLTTATR